jgi:hypothetical protein
MKGKIGLIVGLGAGYVLGTRAGRERYEQIKTQWLKLWEQPAIQKQVDKAKDAAKSAALALPSTVWDSAVKVVKSVSGNGTPGQKLDSAIKTAKDQTDDVAQAARTSAKAVQDAADDAIDDIHAAARDADGA